MPGPEEFADRYAGQPAEAHADEGMAFARRLHAQGGPGYVGHADTTEGAGLAACTGAPMIPIPEGAIVFPCTGCFVVGPKLAEEREMANLGNATTRQLLNELKARGEMVAAEHSADGQYMARMAHRMLHGHARLDDRLLAYRTVGT